MSSHLHGVSFLLLPRVGGGGKECSPHTLETTALVQGILFYVLDDGVTRFSVLLSVRRIKMIALITHAVDSG